MNESTANQQLSLAQSAFFPPTLDSLKRRGKRLKKLVDREDFRLGRVYNLIAQMFGCKSFSDMRTKYLLAAQPATVWDCDINEEQLFERRRFQARALSTFLHVSDAEAYAILDAGKFSGQSGDGDSMESQSVEKHVSQGEMRRATCSLSDAGAELSISSFDNPFKSRAVSPKIYYRKHRRLQLPG